MASELSFTRLGANRLDYGVFESFFDHKSFNEAKEMLQVIRLKASDVKHNYIWQEYEVLGEEGTSTSWKCCYPVEENGDPNVSMDNPIVLDNPSPEDLL